MAWLLLWRLPGWAAPLLSRRGLKVSVIIPARNEERNLPRLLHSLATQHDLADQVIVVDDHSTDATPDIVERQRSVDLVRSDPLPPGWTGKSWACWQGAELAHGDVLVFLDADVELGPDALAQGVAELERRGGLVSVQPLHQIDSPVEMLSLPFNVVAVMGVGVGSVFPPRVERAAAGPFMACPRDDYDIVGGHRSVRHEVVEDLALGRRFADVGLPVTCLAGIADVTFHMYGGVREIIGGWSKNFATGARFTPLLRTLAIALWITASLTAVWWMFEAIRLGGVGVVAAGAIYAAFAGQYAVLGRRVGRFGPASVLWPLLIAFFTAVFAWSLLSTFVLRRVRWRGRDIPIVRGRPRPASSV